SAIVEGQRRLRNRLQEDGFFFNDVSARCAVAPPRSNGAAPPADEGEGAAGELDPSCATLDPEELSGRSVTITYEVVGQPRRFKLTSLRLINADGTTPKLSIEDVRDDLRSREANELLGLLPFFKLGRGYTSNEALSQDQRTILARMRDLGYRQATVEVRQGVSLEGEGLIITFAVNEGPLTRVADVEIRGNKLFTAEQLRAASCPDTLGADEACTVLEGPFSRSQARIDADRLRNYYARRGYLDADVDIAVVDLPERGGDQRVRLVYTVTEAEKVFINRVVVHGLVNTKPEAILEAIPLRAGGVLRADQISESERVLYNTDAFRQVIIRTEPAVETAGGFKARDVIIDVEERRRYVMDYGGGYSTDIGPLGHLQLRNNNLFCQLRQGAFRSRVSPRQQLVRLEYFDPRFMRYAARRRYGAREFAPLTVSAQYQLDSTVTRFFRSTLDRSQFGIVQRLDPEGRPIDINCPLLDFDPAAPDLPAECMPVGTPTINRFTINVETQRDFELQLGRRGEVQKRSTLFLRYNYEDVRLFNIQSLLIADLLRPDRAVRLSRFGVTFA
ncbi:MAG TPA: POTRA domain-containing protein, partial [Pyrinomonadaceae bacterium]|nr:POTRA domain-containing protein [Pyrinomonadaceae bacterium]